MTKNMRSGIIVIALFAGLITPSVTHAQEFKNRVEAIQKEYASMTSVHLIMEVKVFEAKGDQVPYFNETAIVKRNGDNYFYRFSNMEMMMNDEYLILVNEEIRHIACSKRDFKSEEELKVPFTGNIDSLLSVFGTPVLIAKTNNIEHYKSVEGSGSIVSMELYIDTVKNTLTRIDYSYVDGQYVIIDFKLFDRTPAFKESDFEEAKYFAKEKGTLKLSDNYSRFRLSVNN